MMNKKLTTMILSSTMALSMFASSVHGTTYQDMPDDYSTAALESAIANGLLVGHNGLLSPEADLSRAEFATMMVKAFGATEQKDISNLNDISKDDWFYQSFATAVNMGILEGEDGYLRPTEAIQRQEVYVSLVKALTDHGDDVERLEAFLGTLDLPKEDENISRKDFAVILHSILSQYITESGTYTEVTDGDIMITTGDVTLSDLIVTGDLILGDGVGKGTVTLDNITVEGDILVRGGTSLVLSGDTDVQKITVAKQVSNLVITVETEATAQSLVSYGYNTTVKGDGTIVSSNVLEQEEAEAPISYAHELLPVMTDMTGWKVQLPLWRDDTAMSVLEKTGEELIHENYESDIFYVTYEDGQNWLVMDCGVDGAKTSNTSYSRNEFREMLDINDSSNNWEYSGTHILNTTQKVTKVPTTGITVTSQIHGVYRDGENGPVLVKVEYDYKNKAVVVLLKTACDMNAADSRHYFYGVELDQIFETEIKVTGGSIYVTVSSEGRSETYYSPFAIEDPNWYNVLGYFKAGNYVQDSNLDYEGEGATVYMNRMDVYHGTEDQDIKAESIAFSHETVTLGLGETIGLSVDFSPIDTLNKSLTWEIVSGNDFVALTNEGTIVGLSEGTATLRAVSVENPSITAECTVTVAALEVAEPEAIYKPILTLDTETDRDHKGIDLNAGSDLVSAQLAPEDVDVIIQVVDKDDQSTGRSEIHFTPQYGTTTISYDIRVDSSELKGTSKPQTSNIYMDFGGAEGDTLSSTSQAFRIRNNADNTTESIFNNRWGYSHSYLDVPRNLEASKFELGQWKNITVIITPDDGSASANTTTVYMDGQRVSNVTNNNVAVEMINQVNIYSGTADKLSYSLKNINVYSGAKIPASDAAAPSTVTLGTLPTVMSVGNSIQVTGNVNDGANESLVYSISEGSALAISDSGLLVAREVGTATVRVSSALDASVYGEWNIDVLADVVAVESITLDETAIKMNPFHDDDLPSTYPMTYDLTTHLSFLPEDASEHAVSYTVLSGDDFITIDDHGVITATAVGAASIRITSLDNPNATATIDVNVFNDYHKGQEIFRDTFSGTSLDYNNWTSATSNVGNTVTSITQDALFFEDNNNGGQPKSYVAFEPQAETFTIQYDFVLHRDYYLSKASTVNMAFGSGSITSSANEAFRLRTYSGSNGTNRYFRYHDTDGSNNIDMKDTADIFNLNEWVTIALTTTPNNGEENANTTSVYINGELYVENAPNKQAMTTIDQFIFQTGTSDLTSYSVDNFTVWAGTYEDGKDNEGYAEAQRTGAYTGYVLAEEETEEETEAESPEAPSEGDSTETPSEGDTTETPSEGDSTEAPSEEDSTDIPSGAGEVQTWTVPLDGTTNWSGIPESSGSTTLEGETVMQLVTTPGSSVNMHYKLEDAMGTALTGEEITLQLRVLTENTVAKPSAGFKFMNGGTSSSNNVSRFKYSSGKFQFEEADSFSPILSADELTADGTWMDVKARYTINDKKEIVCDVTIDGEDMGQFVSGSAAAILNEDGKIEITHFTLFADSGSTDGTFYYKDITIDYVG